MSFIRSIYYGLINKIAYIEHFTGFGLYDKDFSKILKDLHDTVPHLCEIMVELGYKHKKVYYEQEKRKAVKSKFDCFRLYDLTMLGITSYSKIAVWLATLIGISLAVICFGIGLYSFI